MTHKFWMIVLCLSSLAQMNLRKDLCSFSWLLSKYVSVTDSSISRFWLITVLILSHDDHFFRFHKLIVVVLRGIFDFWVLNVFLITSYVSLSVFLTSFDQLFDIVKHSRTDSFMIFIFVDSLFILLWILNPYSKYSSYKLDAFAHQWQSFGCIFWVLESYSFGTFFLKIHEIPKQEFSKSDIINLVAGYDHDFSWAVFL